MRSAAQTRRAVRELARLRGIQLGYTANDGRYVRSPARSLVAVLGALGHAVEDAASIEAELAEARRAHDDQMVEPVLVMRPGGAVLSPVVVARSIDPARVGVTVVTESGEAHAASLEQLSAPGDATGPGRRPARTLDLAGFDLPVGYHRLRIEGPGLDLDTMLLAPPRRADGTIRAVGVVAPLYAVRGDNDWGVGSYRDLAELAGLVARWGGDVVGTLPIFAASFHEPVDPSPYLPYSRLFCNEVFVDVETVPEAGAPEVAALLGGAGLRRDLEKLRAEPMADYAAVMARKREVLARCADVLARSSGLRREVYESWVVGRAELARYADFRALDDSARRRWHSWSSEPGRVAPSAIDPAAARYHRYVQFVADEQLVAAGRAGAGLYLDLPIGVHPDGYDTWAYDGDFADAGVGAPPDPFFAGGQSWGFPPLHPEAIRRSGYRYLIEAYRQAFRHASVLRIDHVPGLHRMFWIPPGGDATTGAYVRYRHEELRALIAIEAHRVDARVVGEDLGTVTPAIRNAMDRDGMLHSFITRFAATVDDPLPQPRVPSAASVGSQDLPRFAAYWCGNDIDDRLARGEIDESTAMADRRARDALVAATAGTAGLDPAHRRAPSGIRQALQASLDSLATGPAALVLADLADLLGEQVPDNRPGTGPEADNWRWRLPRRLGEIAGDSEVVAGVARITRRRTANAMEGAIG